MFRMSFSLFLLNTFVNESLRIKKLRHLISILYIYFAEPSTKAAETITITPSVHAGFDREKKAYLNSKLK